MKLKHFDHYLVSMLTLVSFYCVYILYGQKLTHKMAHDLTTFAQITEQINTVKHKKEFFQSWADVELGELLDNNEEIYTHGNSSATLVTKDGQKINISENTLLKLQQIDSKSKIVLDKGNLTFEIKDQKNPLKLQIDGKEISIDSKNAQIVIEKNEKSPKISVLSGEVNLNIGKEKINLKENETVVNNQDQIVKFSFKISTSSPTNLSKFYFSNSIEIPFIINGDILDQENIIEVAKDISFKNIIHSYPLTSSISKLKFENEGNYFWRIIEKDHIGPIRQFKILKEKPLNVNFNVDRKDSNQYLLKYQFPVKDNYLIKLTTPNEILEKSIHNDDHFELLTQNPGLYKFIAKIDQKERPDAIWSEEKNFEIKQITEINIDTEIAKEITKTLYSKKKFQQNIIVKSNQTEVKFHLELTHPNATVENLTYNSPIINFDLNEDGEYTWKIIAKTFDQKISSNSISGKIKIVRPIKIAALPSEGSEVLLDRPEQNVNFNWDAQKNKVSYEFELAQDPQFEKIIRTETTQLNKLAVNVEKIGKYFWRVKIKDEQGVHYSEPISVDIKPIPMIEAPRLEKEIKVKLKYINESSFIKSIIEFFIPIAHAESKMPVAEWNIPGNSKVKTYHIEIYTDEKMSKLISKFESNSPHIIWKNATIGSFYWRVSFEDFWGRRTEFSNLSQIMAEEDESIIQERNKVIAEAAKKAADEEKLRKLKEAEKLENARLLAIKEKAKETALKIEEQKQRQKQSEKIIENIPTETYEKRISFSPYLINSTTTIGTKKIKVSGLTTESLNFELYKNMELKYFENSITRIQFSRGKVFSSHTFNQFAIDSTFLLNHVFYEHGPRIIIGFDPKYSVANNSVTVSNQTSVGAAYLIKTEFLSYDLFGSLGFVNGIFYNIGLNKKILNRHGLGLELIGKSSSELSEQKIYFKYAYFF